MPNTREKLIDRLPVDDAILILREELTQRVDGYATHLSYGGKGDPAEEVHIDALEMAISALEQTKWIPVTKPQTKADRIRAMSDEELAVFLADEISHGDCYGCELDCATYECDKFMDCCHNAHYRWLKQPTEVDDA